MKNKTFFQSVLCALKGLAYALRTEKNYRYYLIITLIFLIVNILTNVEFYCYLFQFFITMAVFACECINTAIEHLCNKLTTEVDTEIKLTKDIAAGAVLCWGIVFFVSEFIFIGRALLC
ncbi:MAG: diacylglycerol kinase [Lachnospiraceae bacterium]|nr:diacylglycerol kinase [Lachnospiraceae bacterium]